ncbi:MAG: hypothetical protein NT028_09960 [candidate division Zixibacteria bacterium]|nr:hypothetical protein [candidate division Zixibacteria bacterium]
MSSKRYVSILAVLFAISISLAFVGGCTSNAVAPNDSLIQSKLDWMNEFFSPNGAQQGPGLGECPVLFDTVVTEQVNSSKDEFKIVFGKEEIAFSLPKDALSSAATLAVHATKYQAPFGSFWLLDCGPNGTVFAKPLEVTPNQEVTESNSPVLYYFNPATGLWEVEQITASSNSNLLINHFSMYGIS